MPVFVLWAIGAHGTVPACQIVSKLYNGDVHFIGPSSGFGLVQWMTQIPIAGTYKVYACWLARNDRAESVTYYIKQDGICIGTVSDVNQREKGGQWVQLGGSIPVCAR